MKIRLGSTEIGLTRYLSLWTAVVVAFAVQGCLYDSVNNGHSWQLGDYLRWSMIQWYTWAALAPLVFQLGERFPIVTPLRLRSLGRQLLAGIGVATLAMLIGAVVSPGAFFDQLGQFIGKHFAIGLLTYWGLLAIQQALHYRSESDRRELEASRLATELAQSRLQALKTQLQPHFLFNTLHAIVTLLDDDVASAEDMLLRLSELLRALLEEFDGQEITLRHELTLLDLYLGIQRKRFGDRLTTRLYIDPATLDCAVPSLLLQPIVENAIQHGIGRHAGADCVEIESRREDGQLRIEVRNRNSTLGDGSGNAGHGIGLSNTRLRLRELYGDAAEIRLDMIWPQGVACRIRMPFRELEDAEGAPEYAPA
ncbi:histidine kinase [Xanthomonas translucens pv. arrhenatheri]|uniref:Putative membrane protein n=1 Tax=Xanthomonas graminis pv. arrhenatheri LMG 727 TaxID=1195923 RepID=A0A0K2ZV43_9XANT|nr:histidine kinase [Xanthomonas translucens]OAX66763.1 histidine kinase [Xanthomonas translucens pv. arrhenatheri]UKE78603.1 histidine kinase [Xanthomonas translucens pv. arrhenatheri]CTP88014.1 putative membrane protein [Xanthomonas translucens pv. arrhenatheri LMG 727]